MQQGEVSPPTARRAGARGLRAAAISAVIGWIAACSGSAAALGLGEIVQQSILGEPFRVTIPVLVNAEDLGGGELAPECFRLVASELEHASEIPHIAYGRVTLARNAQGVFAIVTGSSAAANDPALSFTVQAGCRLKVRREYTVLLDPPVIRGPIADASTLPEQSAGIPPDDVRAHGGQRDEGSRARRRSRAWAPAKPTTGTVSARPAAKSFAPTARAAKAADAGQPRLRVSRSDADSTADSTGQAASDITRGRSDEEIRREVEAETLVLQRRIVELSATLEHMEAELRNATAARDNAQRAVAKPPAPPTWDPAPWAVVVILLAVVLLLARMVAGARRLPAFARFDVPTVSGRTEIDSGHAQHPARSEIANRGVESPAASPGADVRLGRFAAMTVSDEEASFENDLLTYAEQRSGYSALEREQPKIVASVVRDWGKPKVIAYLRELLVSPRKASGAFSREAVSDLTLLQSIAMDHAGYGSDDNPWQVAIEARRLRA